MDELVWSEDLNTGIDQIDQDHKGLFAIYAELYAGIRSGASPAQLYAILFKLTTHAEAHFKAEEIQMLAVAYPGFGHHQGRHVQLLTEVGVLTLQFGDPALEAPRRLLEILRPWLLDHLLNDDLAFADWVRASRQAGC